MHHLRQDISMRSDRGYPFNVADSQILKVSEVSMRSDRAYSFSRYMVFVTGMLVQKFQCALTMRIPSAVPHRKLRRGTILYNMFQCARITPTSTTCKAWVNCDRKLFQFALIARIPSRQEDNQAMEANKFQCALTACFPPTMSGTMPSSSCSFNAL